MEVGISLNGCYYSVDALPEFVATATNEAEKSYYQEAVAFLQRWWSSAAHLSVHTSGSTGKPKPLAVSKEHMRNSALLTCTYLGLQAGDSCLVCMPLKYIAAQMMLVRAVLAKLAVWLVPPCGRPLAQLDSAVDFAAMVPLQVYNSLQQPVDKQRLQAVKHLLIGGGAIDEAMAQELAQFPHQVYSSYGMTETVSHIALRHLSGAARSDWYRAFPTVQLSQTEQGALVIDAPQVASQRLYTHDVVRFNSQGEFQVLGRLDNIVNSGGVKLQVELLEQAIRPLLSQPFVLSSRPDAKLGEALVLLIESAPFCLVHLNSQLQEVLSMYERPKEIYFVEQLPRTATQKIRRKACKDLAAQLFVKK